MRRCILVALACTTLMVGEAHASPQEFYRQAMHEAAAGRTEQARSQLAAGIQTLPADDLWRDRLQLAGDLLGMREQHVTTLPALTDLPLQKQLLINYTTDRAAPSPVRPWLTATLAVLLPGAGHAWLGRWHDAAVAAMLVLPMLGLTVWAAFRRMGPVTVFFALITAWLWSGSVFSAWSLAERGNAEAYLLWWQGLWQASGLPGRPW